MYSEASQVISSLLLEMFKTIATDILLIMSEFSELKHDYEIRRKITAKQYEKRNNGRWGDFKRTF